MEILDSLKQIFVAYGLSVVGGILILIAGWIVAGVVSRWTRRALTKRERLDKTLTGFLASLIKYGILAVTIIAVLDQFGIETTSIIAVLGAAGLAIGLAMQGTLGHLASGVMLLIFRPFRVGQFVEVAGTAGTVEDLNLFSTELTTPDNIQIIVPNGRVWGDVVKNYSHHETRRAQFDLGIGYDDDIGKAIETVQNTIKADTRVLDEPQPQVVVGSLGDNSVNLIVRVWCAAGDFWPLQFDLTRAFKESFDVAGISFPYPQQDVHVFMEKEKEA